MKLYDELADWWHLLSAPEDYAEEAAIFDREIRAALEGSAHTLLELGSGGGNNASHLKASWALTLVDVAAPMIEVSRRINPDCEHHVGDMRTVRLERRFDAVFIHDAITYMTTFEDVVAALRTAAHHCRPGGVVLVVPDETTETFAPSTDCGGHDGPDRGMRYLEWSYDPDPGDSTIITDYGYLLRDTDGSVRAVADRHIHGLFSRQQWLDAFVAAGLASVRGVPVSHSELPEGTYELFVAVKPTSIHADGDRGTLPE